MGDRAWLASMQAALTFDRFSSRHAVTAALSLDLTSEEQSARASALQASRDEDGLSWKRAVVRSGAGVCTQAATSKMARRVADEENTPRDDAN